MPLVSSPPCYQRHRPEDTILYRTLECHLETLLARASDQGGGDGLQAEGPRQHGQGQGERQQHHQAGHPGCRDGLQAALDHRGSVSSSVQTSREPSSARRRGAASRGG
jgi:hypothetical protein